MSIYPSATNSKTKFIFVTGGVVSGLGKGITAASIGLILKTNSYRVDAIKFDPYLNVDPGTMSPYEHGEVFVLGDGTECDLDLGHYERFLDTDLTSISSVTAGKIYSSILEGERRGDYLGKNVQLIPHVTNYITDRFVTDTDNIDIRLIEIGGSAGDMEGEIFMEAIRQFRQNNRGQVLHIHLGYVPFLECSGEYKTKPFQNSLRELLRTGLQPHVLVARYEKKPDHNIAKEQLDKLALFGNVEPECIIAVPDLESIYAVPSHFYGSEVMKRLEEFVVPHPASATGKGFVVKALDRPLPLFFQQGGKVLNPTKTIKLAVVGKYGSKLGDADYSVMQSIRIAAFYAGCEVENLIIAAEDLENNVEETWSKVKCADAFLVLGGFGNRGMEGKILAAKYARENKKPFLGICLGLQMAVVEFARNVCGLNAFSAEMLETPVGLSRQPLIKGQESKDIVIDYMLGQESIQKKGGTMRLGNYECEIVNDTLASELFGVSKTVERHRHRLEVQTKYLEILSKNGMKVSGKFNYTSGEGKQEYLPEIMELDQKIHPYFIGIQSHPEMLSRPTKAHPLFLGLIKACL
jgi:CTP synthase